MANFGCCCGICPRLVIPTAVTFAADTLTINLPAGSYADGQRYCILLADALPAGTTIDALAVITIGDDTAEYPLTDRCCRQVTACAVRHQGIYPVVVATNTTAATFKLLRPVGCRVDRLAAVDGTAPATTPPAEGGA